jgi:O-antigen ligase
VAWRKCRKIIFPIGGFQILFVILLCSLLIAGFFPEIAIRTSTEVKASPVNAVNLARTLLVGLVGLATWAVGGLKINELPRGLKGPLGWMFLYACVAVASTAYSSLPLVTAGKALELLTDVAFFVVLAALVSSREIVRLWNIMLLFTTVKLVAVWLSAMWIPSVGFTRPPGALLPVQLQGAFPMSHPNELGELGGIITVVGLARLLRSRTRECRGEPALWSIITGFGLLTLVFSQARTSMLGLLVAVIVCLRLYGKTYLVPLLGAAAVVVGLSAAGQTLSRYLIRGQSPELFLSLTGRLSYWPKFWEFCKEAPFLGHGFYTGYRIDAGDRYHFLSASTTDNTYLDVAVGLGLLGLVPLLAALFLLARGVLWKKWVMEHSLGLDDTRKELCAVLTLVLTRSLTGPSFQLHGDDLLILLIAMAFVQTIRRLFVGATVSGPCFALAQPVSTARR